MAKAIRASQVVELLRQKHANDIAFAEVKTGATENESFYKYTPGGKREKGKSR